LSNVDLKLDQWCNRNILLHERGRVRNYTGYLPNAIMLLQRLDIPWGISYDKKAFGLTVGVYGKSTNKWERVPLEICLMMFRHVTGREWGKEEELPTPARS
jgi:hypothetical protein